MNRQLVIGFLAGIVAATTVSITLLNAQPAAQPQPQPQPVGTAPLPVPVNAPLRPVAQVPGSVQVTRLTDTSFVVVKDQGDAQVVTLFTTEAGLVQRKHAGRFLY